MGEGVGVSGVGGRVGEGRGELGFGKKGLKVFGLSNSTLSSTIQTADILPRQYKTTLIL